VGFFYGFSWFQVGFSWFQVGFYGSKFHVKRKLLLNNFDFWHFPINPYIPRVYEKLAKVIIIEHNFAFETILDFFTVCGYIEMLRLSMSAIIYWQN